MKETIQEAEKRLSKRPVEIIPEETKREIREKFPKELGKRVGCLIGFDKGNGHCLSFKYNNVYE